MKFPIVGTLGLAAAMTCGAQSFYAVTDLGPGRAHAVSEQGHAAGETELRNGDLHAFVWTPDGLTDLGTLGGRSSRAFDINDRGEVVGEADTTNGDSVACRWSGAEAHEVPGAATIYAVNNSGAMAGVMNESAVYWSSSDAPPTLITATGAIGIAFGLSDGGRIVGQAETADPDERVSRAFAYANGVAAGLVELGRGLSSSAQAVNERGQVAGFFEPARGRTHAFLFEGGEMRDLDTMNNAYSAAYGINDKGDVVGVMFSSPNDDDQAFIASGGSMYNLNDLLDTREDWNLVEAWDINDAGQIAGYGIKDGRDHAFLLTPLEGSGKSLPRVRLADPANGAPLPEPASVNLSAEVRSDAAIKRVVFYANGDVVGAAESEPYRTDWKNASAGEYDLVARAFDVRGQMGVSPRVHLEISFTPTPDTPVPAAASAPASPDTDRPAGADAP